MQRNEAIVLGLDGLSWNVVEKLSEEGKLENIQEMIENGASGNLRAEPPLLSPVIWTSIFTGKTPENHGIKDFFSLGKDLKSDQIWDILNRQDFRVGAYRPWSGWNVKEVDGFFIPGFFSFQSETRPRNLKFITELDKRARTNSLNPSFLLKTFFKLINTLPGKIILRMLKKSLSSFLPRGYKEKLYRKKEVGFLLHRNLFYKLLKEKDPEFSVFYDNSCDLLSHNYWKEMETGSDLSYVIPEIYEKIDKFIGRIREYARDNGKHLLVVSDHGFKPVDHMEKQIVIDIPKLLKESGLSEDVYGMNIVEMGVVRLKPSSSKSLEDVKQTLKSFTLNGEEIFDVESEGMRVVFKIEDFARESTPSSIKTPQGKELKMKEIVFSGCTKTGDHCEENGMFLMEGPEIKEGVEIGEVKPWDVTPTLLSLLGSPVPSGADGKVLTDIFKEEPEIKYFEEKEKEKTKEDLTQGKERKVKEKLKDLGYL